MKRLIFKIVIFIAIIVLLDVIFGQVMRATLASTDKGDWGRRNYIMNKTDQDILVFGSSRAVHHFVPQILSDTLQKSCYNCAEDGTGILVHYPRLKRILEKHKPSLVIYDLIPKYDFLTYGDASPLGLLRPYAVSSDFSMVIADIDSLENVKLLSEFYKYNSCFVEILLQRFSSAASDVASFTYSPLQGEMNYEPKAEDLILEGKGVDTVKLKYLTAFVDLCKAYGISLFITASPWYKMQEQEAYAPVYELCKTKGVPFLNHNFDNTYNTNRAYFHDAAHMNQHGAEVFSAEIAHEIKEIQNVQSK